MRNWEVPALLATVALGGLTSVFAQGPAVTPSLEPTPVADVATSPLPVAPSPAPVVINPLMFSDSVPPAIAPEPVHGSSSAPAEYASPAGTPVVSSPASCEGCAAAAPAETVVAAPAASCNSCGVQASAPVVQTVAPPVGSCGCQSGQVGHGFHNYGGSGSHSGVSGVFGVYGSGSGVGSGLLSPVANSGGLHARYPYYNYRHSWYYQGPASQNVTIVW